MKGYQPAGQRSGSHADSVWPYLEESRRQVAPPAESLPAGLLPLPRPLSWAGRLLARLRNDPEAS